MRARRRSRLRGGDRLHHRGDDALGVRRAVAEAARAARRDGQQGAAGLRGVDAADRGVAGVEPVEVLVGRAGVVNHGPRRHDRAGLVGHADVGAVAERGLEVLVDRGRQRRGRDGDGAAGGRLAIGGDDVVPAAASLVAAVGVGVVGRGAGVRAVAGRARRVGAGEVGVLVGGADLVRADASGHGRDVVGLAVTVERRHRRRVVAVRAEREEVAEERAFLVRVVGAEAPANGGCPETAGPPASPAETT